jgi:hypothetical protein
MAPETAVLICDIHDKEMIREGLAGECRGIRETMRIYHATAEPNKKEQTCQS